MIMSFLPILKFVFLPLEICHFQPVKRVRKETRTRDELGKHIGDPFDPSIGFGLAYTYWLEVNSGP